MAMDATAHLGATFQHRMRLWSLSLPSSLYSARKCGSIMIVIGTVSDQEMWCTQHLLTRHPYHPQGGRIGIHMYAYMFRHYYIFMCLIICMHISWHVIDWNARIQYGIV
jgi:hypothetical protein